MGLATGSLALPPPQTFFSMSAMARAVASTVQLGREKRDEGKLEELQGANVEFWGLFCGVVDVGGSGVWNPLLHCVVDQVT